MAHKRTFSGYISNVSQSGWKKWGWILSILAVVFLLFSMVQPDPDKAKRGQLAVGLEAERVRGKIDAELKKEVTEAKTRIN